MCAGLCLRHVIPRSPRALRSWSSFHLAPHEADEGGDGRAARLIFEALGRDGWLRWTSASLEQGTALDLRAVCLLREVSAQSSAIADVALSEPWLGALPLILGASTELKRKYLPGYLAGSLLPAFALSEPDAGSDVQAITTSARREGSQFVINGRKTWTSNCGLADLYIVFARMEGEPGRNDIAAFAVEPGDGGLVFEQRLEVLSPHTVGTWRLEDCRVPASRLIGRTDAGLQIALRSLEIFRPTVGAAAIGFARRALDEAVRRSLARRAFKKPIAEHQLIQAKLRTWPRNWMPPRCWSIAPHGTRTSGAAAAGRPPWPSFTHRKRRIELSTTPFRFSVDGGQERRSRRTALSPRSCVPNL